MKISYSAFLIAWALLSLAACRQQPPSAPDTGQAINQTGPVEQVQHFPTGEVSRKFTLLDGKKQGTMTDYFKDGKVRAVRQFEDDEQVGRTIIYYPDGNINEVQYFEAGHKHGGDSIWYEGGELKMVLYFSHGKKDGYVRKWEPDGSLTFEARYQQDSLVEVKGQKITPKI